MRRAAARQRRPSAGVELELGERRERGARALGVLADMELDSRGGAAIGASRSPVAGLDEDTIALRAIEAITT